MTKCIWCGLHHDNVCESCGICQMCIDKEEEGGYAPGAHNLCKIPIPKPDPDIIP